MQKSRLFLESAICLALIVLVLMLPELQLLDRWLQSFFFDPAAGGWLVQPEERGLLFWAFYKLPKILLVVSASLLVLYLCARRLSGRPCSHARALWAVLLVLALVPLAAGLLKGVTGVSCPVQELSFGGPYGAFSIWDRLAAPFSSSAHFQCWPAGHAAGGFALLGARFLQPLRMPALPAAIYWLPGIAMGWLMGLFQMARGQHYFSHTLVSMLLAWGISSLIMALFMKEARCVSGA